MADQSLGLASFWSQTNALLRKNLTYQKRNMMTNVRLILFPFLLCLLLAIIQSVIDKQLDKPELRCGCKCIDTNKDGRCEEVCGIQYSSPKQVASCPNPNPPEWPPLLQIPDPEFRAVKTNFNPFADLPDDSCRRTRSCPATVLFTANNHSLGKILVESMFKNSFNFNSTNVLNDLASHVVGTGSITETTNFLEPAFASNLPVYSVQRQCKGNPPLIVPVPVLSVQKPQEVRCIRALQLWRNSSSEINDELYKGHYDGNSEGKINEILGGFDFLNSNRNNFNVTIWFNSSIRNDIATSPIELLRILRSVNLATNAYLQFLKGPEAEIQFEFIKEMPKPTTQITTDLSSLLGTLFFTWVILQLFPVVLQSLVYEKQEKLRIMMKMHGLGDGPYWLISYAYFLTISVIYMLCFVTFGSVIGLKIFTLNDYNIQFVFFFLYINLQISLAFLTAAWFSNIKTAAVIGYILVFGTGLLGGFLFQYFLEDRTFPYVWIILMELFPGFALYRGLYEFAQYAFDGNTMGTSGMQWVNLSDDVNGMRDVMIIMAVEWFLILLVAYYVDQISSSGGGKSPLFFLQKFRKKDASSFQSPSLQKQGYKVFIHNEQPDVIQEREKVEELILETEASHSIVCNNIKKVYPGRDGNPQKFAVKGLSLAVPRGECFGMLGPNGAGKSSFISMMIGLTKPSAGTAFIQGLDIRNDMDRVYTSMGVCPQHDLLWEQLTGREHLLFYGRLKNLRGSALAEAVEESLKGVSLYDGGVGDKQARMYSGGMKRRLSVAISLIGDPKVVYMDEPSTGLDPASRNSLWNVVKRAKRDRAIILTTHSMEEAEVLCDRLGIFVDGSLQCIGNAKELKGRYGGSYVFTMTTSANHEIDVENMVKRLSPSCSRIYHIAGTQKFELPKQEVRIADVFQAVESAKSRFTVFAWGLADTTLEDVFIKVARGAQSFNVIS